MKVIGITGGIGCGKSTLTHYLKSRDHAVVDADEIVSKLFGEPHVQEKIIALVGTLDKKMIRKIVFQSTVKRKELEDILHPLVNSIIEEEMNKHRKNTNGFLFVSIPLLFEKDLSAMFDQTVAVVCEEETQLQRLRQRDGIDELMAKHMIHSQLSNAEKAKKADIVIHNDTTVEDFHQSIENLLEKISR
jgi:dephospho-CoA kinase